MTDADHIHLDAVGGVAGDMFVAAMLDAIPQLRSRVLADATAVLPRQVGPGALTEHQVGSVRALRFGLAQRKPQGHGHHHHAHDHDHDGGHRHTHDDAGTFRDMVDRIRAARLSAGTAEHAIAILTHIADAEARIHDVPIAQVHFHEIADWDSLMDVVAAGSISAALPDTTWSVSDLPQGSGLVQTRHGLLPVPAPATAMILEGFSWRDDRIGGERVTPTGAAILRHLVKDRQRRAAGRLISSGTGAGTREFPEMPNILRALVFHCEAARASVTLGADSGASAAEQVAVLSFDIDDMTGEEIGTAADRLRAEAGVLDLSVGTRIGKKGRPLNAFRLLVRPELLDHVKLLVLNETSTIGLRWHFEERTVLPRRAQVVGTGDAIVRVKAVARPDGRTSVKAENDDLARRTGLKQRRAVKAAAEEEDGA